MKSSYLTAGITLQRLSRLVRRNVVSLRPLYLSRLLFLYQSAIWSSLFAIIECHRFRKKVENTPLPLNPIFIIGHWRTGSTLLHKLMSLDKELAVPTLFEVAEPDSFLTSYIYYKPVMKAMISKHRPMDNVILGMNEPQEDEYAVYRITDFSPLEKLVFPSEKKYFLSDLDSYLPDEHLEEWEKSIQFFFKKLFFLKKRTIVSKNPFNSLRIRELMKMFPGARFIHITRHPYEVVPSTIHMWNIVQQQNVLNRNAHKPTIGEVSTVLTRMLDVIEEHKTLIPAGHFSEVRFENLEKDSIGEMKRIYSDLGLSFTPEFESAIISFGSEMDQYQKNIFILTDEEKKIIVENLERHMTRSGYRQ